MSIESRCANPECGKRYSLNDTFAGKSVKCKACGETFVVAADLQATAPAPPRTSGTQTLQAVGRFVIRAKLGAGAFGTVYRAYDPQLEREVALKVPNAGVMTDAKRAERFLREAKAAARLRHPHIVPVFDAGKDGDQYYIASAFIDGKELADDIPERGTDFARAARLARELAEALAYAHGEGIVHRDVKPRNAMLDKQDRLHLMDFGLATRLEEEARMTSDGTVMGTPSYMAPEQARGKSAEVTPAADQYAVGVVLYELLTGEVPFKGPIATVLHNVMHTEPDAPRTRRPDVPKDLETICLKAMSKRPEDRYASCEALAADLRRWQEGEPIAARRLRFPERAARWVRKEPKLAGAFATVCVVVFLSLAIVSLAGTRAIRSASEAEQARLEAERDAATARAAEKRTAEALVNATAADKRATEFDAKRIGAIGTAAEEAQKAMRMALIAEEERSKREAAVARAAEAEQRTKDTERLMRDQRERLLVRAAEQLAHGEPRTARSLLMSFLPTERTPDWQKVVKRLPVWQQQTLSVTLVENSAPTSCAALNRDGTLVATCGEKSVTIWNARSGIRLHTLKQDSIPLSLAFVPNGEALLTVSADATRIWDARTGKLRTTLRDQQGGVECCAFNADATKIVTGSRDGTVQLWDVETGTQLRSLSQHESAVRAVAFSADGSLVVSCSSGRVSPNERTKGQLLVQEVETREAITITGNIPSAIAATIFAPTARRFVSTNGDNTATIWEQSVRKLGAIDVPEFTVAHVLRGHTDAIVTTTWNQSGTHIITASTDGTARVWDAKTGAAVLVLKAHQNGVRSATAHPDGSLILTSGRDGVARLWDANTGQERLVLRAHSSKSVTTATFSADGTRILTHSTDGTIKLWDDLPFGK